MLTKRKYRVIGEDLDEVLSFNDLFLDRANDYEYIYTLQEVADDIMDLKVSQSMFVQLSRDDKDVKGVLIRVS